MPNRILYRWRMLIVALAISFTAATAHGAETRYEQIREMIDDNLHFTAHFTWAVTAETIADLRDQVGPADIPALIRLLGDEEGKIGVAASGLLTTLGDAAVPALQAATESTDWRISSGANDALIRLGECKNNPAGMNPDACPR